MDDEDEETGAGTSIDEADEETGAGALHYAVQYSDKAMTEFLLKKGISVNVMDNNYETPLLRACKKQITLKK